MQAGVLGALAHHITRLTEGEVVLDEIEQLLIALQRAGHLSRAEMVRLQAAYLREARSGSGLAANRL